MIVFDAHCDTATRILDRGEPLFSNSGQLDLRRLLKFQGSIVCFAAFIAPQYSERSMGPGFDCFGIALNLYNVVSACEIDGGLEIMNPTNLRLL